jgi:hypothetical protein
MSVTRRFFMGVAALQIREGTRRERLNKLDDWWIHSIFLFKAHLARLHLIMQSYQDGNASALDSRLRRNPCDVCVAPEYNCLMSSIESRSAVLTAHPSTPNDHVRHLEVKLRTPAPDILVFQYSLVADLSRVRVPPSGAGARRESLWKHTCFEAFIAANDSPSYHEFNFSPSLDWAIYRFSAYREGMSPVEACQAPEISVRRSDDELALESALSLGHLADLQDVRHLRISLAAVIEDNDGRLSYWGLRHPHSKPDFHHPSGFALELTRP